MLKACNRLRKAVEIQAVNKSGQNHFCPYFVIKYLKVINSDPKFAIVVSTKVYKRAYKRNRLRRKIRELLKEFLPNFGSGWYILRVSPKVVKLNESQVLEELRTLLTKVTRVQNTKKT